MVALLNFESSTGWLTLIALKTLIGKTSRRFKELDAEILHRYSMHHYAKSDGVFFLLRKFSPFFGGLRFFGTIALHSDPSKSKINEKKTLRTILRYDP